MIKKGCKAHSGHAIKRICIAIEQARELFGSDCGLFLATDAGRMEDMLRQIYPDIVCREKQFREDACGELHFMKFGLKEDSDRIIKMGEDALIDMYLWAKCKVLTRFPPESYFSILASAFKQFQLIFTEDRLMPVIEY